MLYSGGYAWKISSLATACRTVQAQRMSQILFEIPLLSWSSRHMAHEA
jgi:hypothetical protein